MAEKKDLEGEGIIETEKKTFDRSPLFSRVAQKKGF